MHGYTCFFSDMPQGKGDGKIRRIHGVGIMVCDEWVGQVSRVVKVNERIMWIAGEFQGVYMAFIAACIYSRGLQCDTWGYGYGHMEICDWHTLITWKS
jgi:hypothetical protein